MDNSSIDSSVENVDDVTRRIKVSIKADYVQSEFEAALAKFAAGASIKGFRPGKAPRPLLESLHGDRLRLEVAQRLISSSLNDIVKQHAFDVVGTPSINMEALQSGKPIKYTAEVALFPQPEVKMSGGFEVEVPRKKPSAEDVERALEDLRESKAQLRRVEFRSSAQQGDVCDLSLKVVLPGEKDPRPEPVLIQLGEGRLPADVEAGIAGMEAGTSREFVSEISQSHRDANLRGRQAVYKVTLNAILEKVLPELSDEFVKTQQLGVETVLELRMKIRESLEKRFEREAQSEAEALILEKLVEGNPFEVPAALLDDELRSLAARMGVVQSGKETDFPIEVLREKLGAVALKRVKSAVLVDRIAEIENLRAGEEDLDTRVKEMAAQADTSEEEVRKFLAGEGRLVSLLVDLTRAKVMRLLVEKSKVHFVDPPEEKEAAPENKN